MDFRSEFKITPISDFRKVSLENEIFFWHFIDDLHNDFNYTIQALSQPKFSNPIIPDVLPEIIETFGIKIFESKMSESFDFLISQGVQSSGIYNKRGFRPNFYGFRNGVLVAGTNHTHKCYCTEGVVEVILQTFPEVLSEDLKLRIEKEDLE